MSKRVKKNLHKRTTYQNLVGRIADHSEGLVSSTKNRVPLKLIYYEAYLNREDATHREKYLKTTYGKRYF